jgi:hypothetical protein
MIQAPLERHEMSDKENTTLEHPEVQAEVQSEGQDEAAAEELVVQLTEGSGPQAEVQPVEMRSEPASEQVKTEATPAEPMTEAPAREMGSEAMAGEREAAAGAEQEAARQESEAFNSLLDAYPQYTHPPIGTVLKGQVVKITGPEVIVDIAYKCEGVIPAEEFKDSQGNLKVQPGDEINCLMESTEERDGYVLLSYAKARRLRAWSDIEASYQGQTAITGVVIEKNQGRPGSGCRHASISARLADRRASGAESRRPPGAGNLLQGHQGQPQARQHRGVAKSDPG